MTLCPRKERAKIRKENKSEMTGRRLEFLAKNHSTPKEEAGEARECGRRL